MDPRPQDGQPRPPADRSGPPPRGCLIVLMVVSVSFFAGAIAMWAILNLRVVPA